MKLIFWFILAWFGMIAVMFYGTVMVRVLRSWGEE